MKIAAGCLLSLFLCAASVQPALCANYQCVKPDGKVICTVDSASDPGAQPSDLCNKSCQECYLTCTAVEVIVKSGGRIITGPAGTGSNMVRPQGSDKETAKQVLQEGLVQ